jgi:hypothetical protein
VSARTAPKETRMNLDAIDRARLPALLRRMPKAE